jgi:hypothetical protein
MAFDARLGFRNRIGYVAAVDAEGISEGFSNFLRRLFMRRKVPPDRAFAASSALSHLPSAVAPKRYQLWISTIGCTSPAAAVFAQITAAIAATAKEASFTTTLWSSLFDRQ